MAKILLIENISEFSELYEMNLYAYVGIEDVVKVTTLDEVKEALPKNNFDLIITKYAISGEDILPHLDAVESLKSTPIIIIGRVGESSGRVHYISSGLRFSDLIKTTAKLLGVTAKSMAELIVPDYFPFPIHYLFKLQAGICEIFDRDGEKNTYVRKFEKEDPTFSKEKISIWSKQGVTHLYTHKNDRLKLVNHLSASMISEIDIDDERLNENEVVTVADISLTHLSELISKVGITEATKTLAQKNLKSVAKIAKQHRTLGPLIEKLLQNKNSYLFRHVQVLTFISLHVMKHVDWGNEEQEDKLAFISFFHDICLYTDQQAKIHSKEELRASGLVGEEKTLVEKHAMQAAGLAMSYPKVPMGVDTIIRQHHGMMNGVGFSESFGANLSPLAIVFIIAEEYTRLLFTSETSFSHKKAILELKNKFKMRRFSTILDAIEKVPVL